MAINVTIYIKTFIVALGTLQSQRKKLNLVFRNRNNERVKNVTTIS